MAAIADKHKRVDEINRPKIILAGGSNLAFGINSKKLQDEFDVPVVNLGLHAGLGLQFIINELKTLIKKEDVIILSIEYFLNQKGSYDLQNHTKDLYPEAHSYYDKTIVKDILVHIEKTRKNLKSINESKTVDTSFSVYSRKGFNKFGDVVSHLDQTSPKELKGIEILTYRNWDGIKDLNDFYEYAKAIDVNIFFVYPNYPKSEYIKNQKVLNKLHAYISENLLIEVLSTPQDFIFDDSLFYDTHYHLNKYGRESRTNKLIEVLKESTNAQQSIKIIGQ